MCCVMPPASVVGDIGLADRIQQRRLAVIDVAHDGDDRRAREVVLRPVGHFLLGFGLLLETDDFGAETELGAHFLGDVEVQRLVDGGQDPLGDELLDDVLRLDLHLFRELFQGHAFGDRDRLEIFGRRGRTREFDHLGDPFDRRLGPAPGFFFRTKRMGVAQPGRTAGLDIAQRLQDAIRHPGSDHLVRGWCASGSWSWPSG